MSSLKSWWKSTARYFREVWVEVRPKNGRVSWPSYESVKISTKVVIISSLAIGAFIGIVDIVFGKILSWVVGGGIA